MCIPRFSGAMKPIIRQPLYYTSYRWLRSYQNTSGRTYYDVLGVKPDASKAEIKNAFYKLSKKYHPDATRNSANENVNAAMYLEIMDAYEVLKDRKKRRDYDSRLSNPSGARPTYEDYPTTDQPHRSRSDPPNFYSRTPRYENDKWFEWYKRRREEQMEKSWTGRREGDDWLKTLAAFFLAFFVFSIISRIRFEHLRRKDYIEQMRRYEHDRRGDERFQEMVRKAREEHDMAAAERNTSKAVTAIKINELVEQTPPKNL